LKNENAVCNIIYYRHRFVSLPGLSFSADAGYEQQSMVNYSGLCGNDDKHYCARISFEQLYKTAF
jgi:hypothetical protein